MLRAGKLALMMANKTASTSRFSHSNPQKSAGDKLLYLLVANLLPRQWGEYFSESDCQLLCPCRSISDNVQIIDTIIRSKSSKERFGCDKAVEFIKVYKPPSQ